MKPVVDRLGHDMGERLVILRVNIQDESGQQLAREYGFQYTPTFILFDANGKEIWRQVGGLDVERIRQFVQ